MSVDGKTKLHARMPLSSSVSSFPKEKPEKYCHRREDALWSGKCTTGSGISCAIAGLGPAIARRRVFRHLHAEWHVEISMETSGVYMSGGKGTTLI